MRLPEQEVLAKIADRRPVAHELEVPRAVHGVAVEHGSLNLVALDDELLVHAARRVLEHELLGIASAREVAGREEIDARDLELRRRLRARVAADAELGEMIRDDLRLLEQRRDEAIARAAMLHALAERVDARIVGLHGVVDEHTAIAGDAARLRERGVRPNADRHDDEIGGHLACRRANLTPRTRSSPKIAAVCAGMTNLRPRSSSERFSSAPADASSCRSISVGDQVHDGDLHAALLEPVSRLEAEQPAADDDGVLELRATRRSCGRRPRCRDS